MLGMTESRVREYAREALASLSPRTAERVDPQWIGQVGDYLLGQQSGPQAKATRGHLKRSEAARTWALSMLDSLGDLYQEGAEPTIPAEGPSSADESGAARGEQRSPRRAAREERPREEQGAAGTAEDRDAAAEHRRRERRAEREARSAERRDREPAGAPSAPLSAGAREIVRKRRIAGAAIAGLLVLAGAIFLVTQVTGGDENGATGESAGETAATAEGQAVEEVLGQFELEPVEGGSGRGGAVIVSQQGQPFVVVTAKLEPIDSRDEAYGVWLYNSDEDAVALGAQVTDRQGNFVGQGALPEDFEDYEAIDISRQPIEGEPDHSGESILRGEIVLGEVPEGGGAELPVPPEGEAAPPAPQE